MSAPAGPYTVTHRKPHSHDCESHAWASGSDCICDARVLSRWAYATLEGARGCVQARLREHVPEGAPWSVAGRTYTDFDVEFGRYATADGGTIKLPDGSEIVVEATTWGSCAEAVPGEPGRNVPLLPPAMWSDGGRASCPAAWNAEYGIEATA